VRRSCLSFIAPIPTYVIPLGEGCLLWIDKARAKHKTYIWVSVLWKTNNWSWRMYTPRMHCVVRQNKLEHLKKKTSSTSRRSTSRFICWKWIVLCCVIEGFQKCSSRECQELALRILIITCCRHSALGNSWSSGSAHLSPRVWLFDFWSVFIR